MDFEQVTKEVVFTAVRSRGPGGQNVNKVSSAAQLTWDFENSAGLRPEEKALVRSKLQSSVNKDGILYLRADEFRDLEKNKDRCLQKLRDLLAYAFHKPKKRKATRPTRASKERKREFKSRRGEIKRNRQKIW